MRVREGGREIEIDRLREIVRERGGRRVLIFAGFVYSVLNEN